MASSKNCVIESWGCWSIIGLEPNNNLCSSSLINLRCGKRISCSLVLYALSLYEDVELSPLEANVGLVCFSGEDSVNCYLWWSVTKRKDLKADPTPSRFRVDLAALKSANLTSSAVAIVIEDIFQFDGMMPAFIHGIHCCVIVVKYVILWAHSDSGWIPHKDHASYRGVSSRSICWYASLGSYCCGPAPPATIIWSLKLRTCIMLGSVW